MAILGSLSQEADSAPRMGREHQKEALRMVGLGLGRVGLSPWWGGQGTYESERGQGGDCSHGVGTCRVSWAQKPMSPHPEARCASPGYPLSMAPSYQPIVWRV